MEVRGADDDCGRVYYINTMHMHIKYMASFMTLGMIYDDYLTICCGVEWSGGRRVLIQQGGKSRSGVWNARND